MKKILSLVLAALMVFSMVPAIFAEEVADTTAAVEEVSEYQAAIDFLKLLGIYVGTSEDSFVAAAKEPVNRAQMALFTSRFITGQVDPAYWMTSENDSGFTDVDDLYEEAIGAISFASQKGIVNGVGEGLFDPETGVQYREAITMIVRALGYTYKASGYPWSYINKAREIGLLDGIANIGYTEQINREVVAQLLFNALFVEQDGTNVAESVFNVGATVVMITATNSVVYGNESKVTRTDYVRFQELDAQGEPTGAAYHVAAGKFDLDTKTYEDDAAVGTLYAVTYKNGCADILAYESLTTVYENRGAESNYYKDNYLYIDGSKLRVVTKYNDLYNNQGWNADAAGTAEVKLYQTYGLTVTTGGNYSEYVIDSFKNIFKLTETGYDLVAHYSTVMNKYYDAKTYKVLSDAEVDAMFAKSTNALGGFKKVTSFASKVAYADFIASDANLDGVIDRVAMKQYTFGKVTFGKKLNKHDTSSDKSTSPTFNVQAVKTSEAKSTQTMTNVIAGIYGGDGNGNNVAGKPTVGDPFVSEYRWTGETLSGDAYVLYYVDTLNKEIDILKVVDADAADGTYTVKGYLRGYNAATDKLYIGTEYTEYTIGYDILNGAPLKSKAVKDNQAVNVTLIQPLINTYVELVIVDNKVVMINGQKDKTDFVVIDSFVGFEEDGIVANAYTTVTNEYTQIKIAEYNGWNVGGFDYTLLYLSAWLGDTAFAKVPVQKGVLYQVVYTADGVYNLTNPAEVTAENTLTVNAYGYLEGINKDGVFGAANYTNTSDKDYWLILVEDTKEVVSLSGKLQPGVSVTGNAYKYKENDFVFTVNTKDDIKNLDNMFGTASAYVMYNASIYNVENQFMFNPNSAYKWSIIMQNVKTGGSEVVYIDSKLANGWDGAASKLFAQLGFAQGNIYKANVDANGLIVLSDVETLYNNFEGVAKSYANKDGYSKLQTVVVEGGKIQNVYDKIAEAYIAAYYGDWTDANTIKTLKASFAKKDYITAYGVVDKALKSNADSIVADATKNYKVEFIFNKDGKAFAWVVDSAVFAVNGTCVFEKESVVKAADGSTTPVDADHTPVVTYVYNSNAKTYTVTYTSGAQKVSFKEGTVKVWIPGMTDSVAVPAANVVAADDLLTSFTYTFENVDAQPAEFDFEILLAGGVSILFH